MSLRTIVVAVLVAGAFTLPCSAQDRRPLAVEDYYRIRDVGSPEISPDGNWVAFTVSRRIEATNADSSEVWLVATDGRSDAKRISRAGENARSPEWQPDGALRYRGTGGILAVKPVHTGVPAPVADGPDGLASPDGRWRVRVVETRAPPKSSPPRTDFEARHEDRFVGKRFDWLNFQRDGADFPTSDPRDPTANPSAEIVLFDAAGREERRLTRLGLQPQALAWAGPSIVFAADSTFREERSYGRTDLWVVDLQGNVRRLTRDDRFVHRAPAVSPDGGTIAFVRSYATDYVIRESLDHGGPTDLWVMPVAGGDPVNLTADWDLQAGSPMWSPDGQWLYFEAGIGGERHLFRVPAAGGAVEQVTAGPRRIGGLTIDDSFDTMAYLVQRFDAPAEVHVARIDGSNERRLSHVNDGLVAEIAFADGERVTYESTDGTAIEGWVMLPPDYDPARRYPLIVSSHGGPHSASGYDFDFKLQLFAASGYIVLETNFRSSTGYGEDFLWATWGEWGTKDGDDVMAGVDHVLANYGADPHRVGTTGHSYGGFMTNWLITQYPDRFAAAITGAGISNWVSDYGTADIARTKETEFYGYPWEAEARAIMMRQSPLTYAGRVKTPTLFVHGEVDQRVPYEEAEQMYTALKKNGVPAAMLIYDGQSHGIRGHWNVVHRMLNERAWWDRWLKPAT